MKRILFISPLDRRVVANTREQNMAEQCRALGHETLSLTLAQNTSRTPWAVLRDSLSWRVQSSDANLVIRIDPLLNPCTGLQTNLADDGHLAAPGSGIGPEKARYAKRRLVSVLSPLGVLRDVTIIPTFLLHAVRLGRFDLCIAYGPWAACVGWLLRRLGRVGVLVYDDQDYEPAIMCNQVRQRWAAFLERAMMQRANAVVSVGGRLAALRRLQTGREVDVVANGFRAYSPSASTENAQARGHEFTLIYVGNVVGWSGLDTVVAALPEVLASGQTLRVVIVGDGLPGYVAGLRAQVQSLGLRELVRFVGRVPNDQIGEWLAQADVGLALFRPEPYRRYAFPLKVVEYMAAGLAVLGTTDTETADILNRHGSGIAVPFDIRGIAQGILRLATDAALREQCRRRALLAAPAYWWSVLAERELAIAEAASARCGRAAVA